MDKDQEIADHTLRIQSFLEAAKKILKEIKPVDSSNVVLFNGPPRETEILSPNQGKLQGKDFS
jgi:hypothetical protein